MQLAPSNRQLGEENLTELARSKVESDVHERHDAIDKLAKDSLPYALISSEPANILFYFAPHAEIDFS